MKNTKLLPVGVFNMLQSLEERRHINKVGIKVTTYSRLIAVLKSVFSSRLKGSTVISFLRPSLRLTMLIR